MHDSGKLPLLRFLLLLVVAVAARPASAQQRRARPRYEDNLIWHQPYYRGPLRYGLSVGRTVYFGDLSQGLHGNRSHNSIGLALSYTAWPNLDVAVEGQYLRLAGVDQVPERGYRFFTRVAELTLVGRYYVEKYHFDPAADTRDQLRAKRFRPFVLVGVGAIGWWAKTYGGPDATAPGAPNFNGERTYPAFGPVVPLGGGVAVRVSPRLWMLAEASYRLTFTDDLDDVGAKRGGGRNDGYAQFALRFQYTPPRSAGRRLAK